MTENLEAQTPLAEEPETTFTPEQPDTRQPAPVQEETSSRRIGTLTFGIALILCGTLALALIFRPDMNLITIMKASPALLVLLGIEVLSGYILGKKRMRYDFLGGFFCVMIIFTSMFGAFFPTIWNTWGPPAHAQIAEIERQAEDYLFTKLQSTGSISGLQIHSNEYYHTGERSLKDSRIFATFDLSGSFDTPEEFAQSCKTILERIGDPPFQIGRFRFRWSNDNTQMTVEISDRFQQNLDVPGIAALVEIDRFGAETDEHFDDDSYIDEPDAADDSDIDEPYAETAGEIVESSSTAA